MIRRNGRITKWDVISDVERESLEATPFGRPCTACGEMLATEGDFARHFVVPDLRYMNLGHCPFRSV